MSLRAILSLFLLACTLPVAGCAARRFPYPEAPRVSAKHAHALRAMASDDLLCDEDALALQPDGARLFTVSGCERRSDYVFLCAYGHCRFREVGSLADRAAFDLACDGPVATEHLGGNAWGIEACGRRATYVVACGAATTCAWVPASAMPLVDAVEGVSREASPPEAPDPGIESPPATVPSADAPPAPASSGSDPEEAPEG